MDRLHRENFLYTPRAEGNGLLMRTFTAIEVLIFAAAALVIVAALAFNGGGNYQAKAIPALVVSSVESGIDLLAGLPLPR